MVLLMPSGWSDRFPRWACRLGSREAVSNSLGVSSRMLLFLTPRHWPEAAMLPWNQQKTNPPPAALARTGTHRLFVPNQQLPMLPGGQETMLGTQGSPQILGWISTPSDIPCFVWRKAQNVCITAASWAGRLQGCQSSPPSPAVLALCWLPSGNGFSSPSGGTEICPTPDTFCHLPRCPWGCSEMTWKLPGYWLFLGQRWLRCRVGVGSTAGHPDPCCCLQGY